MSFGSGALSNTYFYAASLLSLKNILRSIVHEHLEFPTWQFFLLLTEYWSSHYVSSCTSLVTTTVTATAVKFIEHSCSTRSSCCNCLSRWRVWAFVELQTVFSKLDARNDNQKNHTEQALAVSSAGFSLSLSIFAHCPWQVPRKPCEAAGKIHLYKMIWLQSGDIWVRVCSAPKARCPLCILTHAVTITSPAAEALLVRTRRGEGSEGGCVCAEWEVVAFGSCCLISFPLTVKNSMWCIPIPL